MLRPLRRDGETGRPPARRLAAVYRFAFAVLPDEAEARAVTRATFERARARLDGTGRWPPRHRLVDTAWTLARDHEADGNGHLGPLPGGECAETERLLSRTLDGGLRPADGRRLRAHLARCGDCRERQRSYWSLRHALRSLAAVPVPAELVGEGALFTSSAPGGSLACEERRPVGIVNRRNAVLGWAAWQVGKRVAKRKAKDAVPSIDPESKRPNKPALAAAVAALVGGLVFWRRQRDGGSGSDE